MSYTFFRKIPVKKEEKPNTKCLGIQGSMGGKGKWKGKEVR